MAARLFDKYRQDVVPAMMQRFGYGNVMQVPKVVKVVLNMGVGEAVQNAKAIEGAVQDLSTVSGQKPVVRRARKSVSNFKLREGMPVGAMVTLRRERMYEFLDRFFSFSIPRIRDFRGLSTDSFDGRGNYTMGIREQIIFPEIDYDKIDEVRGLDVTIVTTARTDEEATELLRSLGMPFVRPEAA
jgi:large subunit ribosomal protein L5